MEDLLPEAAQEAVARRVGEVDRAIADVAVAVPTLRGERALGRRVCRAEAGEQRVVHAAVHVHEADGVELLVAGEATAGLAGDGAGRIVGAVGVAALAPGVIREALEDGPALIGD